MLGLDKMLNPGAVSARVTQAGFHAADDVVHKSEEGGTSRRSTRAAPRWGVADLF